MLPRTPTFRAVRPTNSSPSQLCKSRRKRVSNTRRRWPPVALKPSRVPVASPCPCRRPRQVWPVFSHCGLLLHRYTTLNPGVLSMSLVSYLVLNHCLCVCAGLQVQAQQRSVGLFVLQTGQSQRREAPQERVQGTVHNSVFATSRPATTDILPIPSGPLGDQNTAHTRGTVPHQQASSRCGSTSGG